MSEDESNFIERIASNLSTLATSKIVFYPPVEQNDVIIIPVAKIRYGFGGGYKALPNNLGEKNGGGVGFGVTADAIGYIEVKEGQARFKPIVQPISLSTLILTSGVAGYLLLRAIKKLFK